MVVLDMTGQEQRAADVACRAQRLIVDEPQDVASNMACRPFANLPHVNRAPKLTFEGIGTVTSQRAIRG
jgi:hypothetical protein